MIALYKMQSVEDQINTLLSEMAIPTSQFYSANALIKQLMNPMVVICPFSFKHEVESLPVPTIPLSMSIQDIIDALKRKNIKDKRLYYIVSSQEEAEWLMRDQKIINNSISIEIVTIAQFRSMELSDDHLYMAPIWEKHLYQESSLNQVISFIKPKDSSLVTYIKVALSLREFTNEVIKERYQVEAIVNSAHDGVIAVDREGNITVVNQHAKTILGLNDDVKGHKITEFIPQSDMIRVLQTGKIETGDIATIAGRQIVINRFPIIVKNNVVGAVSNFKQIHDIQKMELHLRKKLHQSGLEAKYHLSNIVGSSSEITEAKQLAERYAETGATVLITGESGTGKEMFAQGIHLASTRALGPFIDVNCAALPDSLLESELFGYEEGAFTGARKGGKAGLFELAHGGTLFLDEIGEIPLRIQTLLLRVLQEKSVRRIGGERMIPVDVRIIAATNQDLETEIEMKRFRSDLFYRLNVLPLDLPPLRNRLEDIPMLINSIVDQLNEQRKEKIITIDKEIFPLFLDYEWPGNIRELRNIIERVMVLETGDTLTRKSAEFFLKKIKHRKGINSRQASTIKENEMELIAAALEKHNNNKTLAAKSLGVDRSTLWRKIKEYKL